MLHLQGQAAHLTAQAAFPWRHLNRRLQEKPTHFVMVATVSRNPRQPQIVHRGGPPRIWLRRRSPALHAQTSPPSCMIPRSSLRSAYGNQLDAFGSFRASRARSGLVVAPRPAPRTAARPRRFARPSSRDLLVYGWSSRSSKSSVGWSWIGYMATGCSPKLESVSGEAESVAADDASAPAQDNKSWNARRGRAYRGCAQLPGGWKTMD